MPLTENFNVPAIGNSATADLDQMRVNWRILQAAMLQAAKIAPSWTTVVASTSSPQDYSQPESMTISKADTTVSPNVTEQYQYLYTWTSGNLTGIVYKHDYGLGAGLETITGGTMTLTFDGLGNFTGATPA